MAEQAYVYLLTLTTYKEQSELWVRKGCTPPPRSPPFLGLRQPPLGLRQPPLGLRQPPFTVGSANLLYSANPSDWCVCATEEEAVQLFDKNTITPRNRVVLPVPAERMALILMGANK